MYRYNISGISFLILFILVWSTLYACTKLKQDTEASQKDDGDQIAKEVLSASIGSEPEQLGYEPGDESASQGPCSFAVDEEGRIYILDPVKHRIQVYEDGDLEKEIPLPTDTAQDIRLLPNGNIVLLDAWSEGKLFVIDRDGSVKSEIPVEGIGLPKASLAGLMHVRPDGVWVEGRRRLVRVMDERQMPDAKRPILSVGDLSKDGKWLIDYALSGISLTMISREREGMPKHRNETLYFQQPIIALIGRGFDDQGRLYIATLHDPETQEEQASNSHLIVLTPELGVVRRTRVPEEMIGPDNLFRNMDVTSNGDVYFFGMNDENNGLVVRRYGNE